MTAANGGMIIGTAAYMSPEQARGKNADARSDVFSLGCVLYEMLTGRLAFHGEEVSDILASVLARDPDFAVLPANVTPQIRKLLRPCLEKNQKERWQAAGDVRIEIQDALGSPNEQQVQATAPPIIIRNTRREWMLSAIAAASLVSLALTIWAPWHTTAPASPIRVTSELGADVSLATGIAGNSARRVLPWIHPKLAFRCHDSGTERTTDLCACDGKLFITNGRIRRTGRPRSPHDTGSRLRATVRRKDDFLTRGPDTIF